MVSVPLALIAGSAIAGNVLAPTLLPTHPLLLLALNATTRHLVLTSTTIDVVPYVVVGVGRRLLEDPFLYLIGRWYGDDAVRWVDRKVGGGRFLRAVQRNFNKVGWLLVAIAPGGAVLVLAGASGMPLPLFLVLNIVGTVATVVLLRRFGDTFAGPIDAIVAFSADNVVALTATSVALTLVYLLQRRRVARTGPDPVPDSDHPEEGGKA